jgi:3-phosphoshikimate 1-carboxyvinyltransferase
VSVRLVEPAASLQGGLVVSAVKGLCQRAVLLAAIADGESTIRGFGHMADTDVAISAVRGLGVRIDEPSPGSLHVHGVGLRGLQESEQPFDCMNAGTLLRLAAGVLAGQEGKRFTLVGDESLSRRPHERVAIPLRQMGAKIETTDGSAPVHVEGAALQPISYALPVASAQVKSAILLAGLYAESGPTTVIEPAVTRDHTERILTHLGVRVSRSANEISVWPVERIAPFDVRIAGDFSSAAPFLVAATLASGSELRIHDVNLNPTRTGFLDVLNRMGARITVYNRRNESGEPVADLEVRSAELTATEIRPEEVPNLVDELPLFALVATMARGESVVRGAEELRAKETDRIETTVDSLRALGAHITSREDGFVVRGVPTRLEGGRMHARGDHRIAMLGAVAGVLSRTGVRVEDPDCVAVSFPDFFELLDSVTVVET